MGWIAFHRRVAGCDGVARWLRSIVPMALSVMTGCATEDASRAFQRTYPAAAAETAAPGPRKPTMSVAAGSATPALPRSSMTPGMVQSEVTPPIVAGVCDPGLPRMAGLTEASYNAGPIAARDEKPASYPKTAAIEPRPKPADQAPVATPPTAGPSTATSALAASLSEASSVPVPSAATSMHGAAPAAHDPDVKPTAGEETLLVPCPDVIPPPSGTYPIDLATALRLADVSNPTIGAARTMILEALALQLTARTLLMPSLNWGASYRGHNGVLQRPTGKIINLSLQSVYLGAGVNPIGSGTDQIPGVNIFAALTDALFEPLAARQRLAGANFGAQATSYDILLDVAVLHLELLGTQSIVAMQRLSESEFYEVYRLAKDYADAGEGREADAYRARSQWKRRRALVQKAEEDFAVTAARLANRLNLDPAVRLDPIGGPLVPLTLVPLETPQGDLIQVALRQRPDIQARSAAIGEAEARHKQEIARPLLPTIWLGYSGGVFGGGSNLVPPLVGNFASRTDFDVDVYWTLMNLGAGNLALIKERHAQMGQAIAERSRTINRARDEVSASLAEARAAQNVIDVARRELAAAELSYKEDLDRTKFRGGAKARDVLPIELLNSVDLLASARVNLVRALVRYDQSQYRLWVSLGSPPPLGSD
jgi:outer membrane protein TolC